MSDNIKVTLALPYTDKAGKNHRADTTLSLPEGEAIALVSAGRARDADGDVAATVTTDETKKD